MHILEHNMLWY